jgi:hypothetical protein
METIAKIVVITALSSVIILNIRYLLSLIFTLYMFSWMLCGFGFFLALMAGGELTFASTPFLSALIGYIVFAIPVVLFYLLSAYTNILEFD